MFAKTAMIAATAMTLGFAGQAHADHNYFGLDKFVEESCSGVTFRLVTVENASTLEVYEMDGSERAAMVGSTELRAGANADVRVPLQQQCGSDHILAVINSGGEEVASHVFELE